MKIRQIIGAIILLGFIVHAFITPVFYVEWIVNFMAWASVECGKFFANAVK